MSPEAKAHILEELTAVGRAGKLRGFELIKAIHTGEQWSCPQKRWVTILLTVYQSALRFANLGLGS